MAGEEGARIEKGRQGSGKWELEEGGRREETSWRKRGRSSTLSFVFGE